VCLPYIVEEFIRLARSTLFFFAVPDNFVANGMLELDFSKAFGERLDTFFPFDPCLLKKFDRFVLCLCYFKVQGIRVYIYLYFTKIDSIILAEISSNSFFLQLIRVLVYFVVLKIHPTKVSKKMQKVSTGKCTPIDFAIPNQGMSIPSHLISFFLIS
jgi:hypothetical protein